MQSLSRFFYSLVFLFSISLYSEIPVPELSSRVMDFSGVLSSEEKVFLEKKLESLEDKKGSQVVILILPTIDGEPIEQFSLRVVEKWKLGRKKVNDGVLVLVAKDDRKMRIEVGYGLEGVLPDAICKRIISEQMRPSFKAKKFYEGLDSAVESISKLINGESLPPPQKKAKEKSSEKSSMGEVAVFCIFILFFGVSMTSNFTSTIGRILGAGIFSAIGSFFLMVLLAFGNLSTLLIIIAGIIGFLLFFIIIYWWSQNGSDFGGSGSSGGYWSSSSSGSSWSSSDSISSGGGDFGGGGASGDW